MAAPQPHKYLTGCIELFREGYTDVCQFTLVKDR